MFEDPVNEGVTRKQLPLVDPRVNPTFAEASSEAQYEPLLVLTRMADKHEACRCTTASIRR